MKIMRSLQCLLAASALATSVMAQEHSASVQEPQKKRVLHELDPPHHDHIHITDLTDLYEDYYIHGVEGSLDLSMSMPGFPPMPKGKGYSKGWTKGYSKGKGKGKSSKKMMKSKSKGKKSSKKGMSHSHKGGGYWYDYEHKGKGGEPGYWYEHDGDHSHHYGDGYYYTYEWEYYEYESKGYGKGKGSSGGKGMSMKMGKSYKGKGYPAYHPDFPTTSPTYMPTSSPTVPHPTASPSEPGPSITLDGYTLTFTFTETVAPPDTMMLDELTMLTGTYLDEFMRTNFGSGPVMFDFAMTTRENFVAPNEVDFETTVRLFPSSVVPSVAEFNQAIRVAFLAGPVQDYIALVKELPRPNVFRNTASVAFQLTSALTSRIETTAPAPVTTQTAPTPTPPNVPVLPTYTTPDGDSGSTGGDGGGGAILAAASAGAFVLVVAGYVVYRRSGEDLEPAGKFIDPDGHMTVTGDTYVGGQSMEESTYAGTQSVDAESAAPRPNAYRSETPEWKDYHANDKAMMSEMEWEEYQESLEHDRTPSPFESIPEEGKDADLPHSEEEDSVSERIMSELDDVTL
eukprot:scaffold7349_cov173-Amphora_coffeaeformis.AAC.21